MILGARLEIRRKAHDEKPRPRQSSNHNGAAYRFVFVVTHWGIRQQFGHRSRRLAVYRIGPAI